MTVPDVAEDAGTNTAAETDEAQLPALSVVIGSTSTAKTTTYLTAAAVYTTEDLLSDPDSAAAANASVADGGGGGYYNYNYSSVFLKYLVAADDASLDLR